MTPWPPRASDPSNGRPSASGLTVTTPALATETRWPPPDPSAQQPVGSCGSRAQKIVLWGWVRGAAPALRSLSGLL
jgi:hypothetical protein